MPRGKKIRAKDLSRLLHCWIDEARDEPLRLGRTTRQELVFGRVMLTGFPNSCTVSPSRSGPPRPSRRSRLSPSRLWYDYPSHITISNHDVICLHRTRESLSKPRCAF